MPALRLQMIVTSDLPIPVALDPWERPRHTPRGASAGAARGNAPAASISRFALAATSGR